MNPESFCMVFQSSKEHGSRFAVFGTIRHFGRSPEDWLHEKMKGLHIENTIDEQESGEQIVMAQTKQIEAELLQ